MSQAITMASSPSAFLASTLSTTFKHKKRKITPFLVSSGPTKEKDDDPSGCGEGMKLAKLAIVTLAAGVITFGSVHEASAAKSGGRVGGQAFRSSAPRSSSPRINNSRTNIYVNPPIAPPLVGGYGFGVPFYGGWGWSPFSFSVPGPGVGILGGGFEIFALLMVFGAVSTIIRRFTSPGEEEDDDY